MQNLMILLVLFLVIAFLALNNLGMEGYTNKIHNNPYTGDHVNAYYLPRAYGHNVYDTQRLDSYPYNYKPYPFPGRFDYYKPNFYTYGYGHL